MVPITGGAQKADTDRAVAIARSGCMVDAIKILAELYAANPNDKNLFHDYLTVLSWAGQDDRVAELTTRLVPQSAPAYALEAAAQSARRHGDYTRAEDLYRTGLHRFPEDPDFPSGLILTLVDAGHSQESLKLAEQFEQKYPQEPALQLAKGYALEVRRQFFTALQNYTRILDQYPNNSQARARRILVLDNLGASHVAVELAREDPSLLTSDEWQRILSNQGTFAVRWGELPVADETHRFDQTDRALALLERKLAELDPVSPASAAFVQRARFDRMVALRNRFQMEAVVREYENLAEEEVVIPNYALSAAADAYLYLKQPEDAKRLYCRILDTDPDDLDTNLSLFYALVELEDFASAYALIDQLDKAEPAWLTFSQTDGRSKSLPNPNKFKTVTTAAMARVYGEQYAAAEERLTVLHARAPANLDIIHKLGYVYANRGWPRLAKQTYELGLGLDYRHKELQLGLAQSYLERREYRLAEQAIKRLYTLYPEDIHVRRLQRQWQIHNLLELRLAAGYADNSGTAEGSREMMFEVTLFSRPLDYNYRMFLISSYAFAAFPEGNETFRRHGLGVEYRRPDLEVATELTYNVDDGDEIGGGLSLRYELDDHWSIPLNLEIFSRDTPLRAVKNEITADSADLGISYRASEQRGISLQAQVMDFSDGNFRRNLAGRLNQRMVTLPNYKLNGIVDVYASANSRDDTIYFNPDRDLSTALTLDNLHRVCRRYDRVFSHRLALTIGNYWQKGYADDYLAGVTYEHIWEAAERFELVYGFSRFRRVYDGLPEYQNYYYTRLNWRF